MNEPTPPVAGVILAGGQSRRMGRDKALAVLGGRPLIAHVAARLRPQVTALAISANGEPARFADLGVPILPDPIVGFPGPLAGVLAGLIWARRSGESLLATVPVDTPFLPHDLVARLTAALGDAEAAVATSQGGADHPTVALWRTDLADDLAAWLAGGGDRAVRAWHSGRRTLNVVFADGGGDDPFFNINTPADLDRAAERWRKEQA